MRVSAGRVFRQDSVAERRGMDGATGESAPRNLSPPVLALTWSWSP